MDQNNFIKSIPPAMGEKLFSTVNLNRKFHLWMGFLTLLLIACLFAYYVQLRDGLGVAGIRDFVSWGIYLSSFVFFVATSLVGMLISSVVGLAGKKWVVPITRLAEIIAVAFAAIAGLVIVSDMGRPDRLPYVFMYGRFASPILWDVTVVTLYFAISFILLYVTLIPDLALGSRYLSWRPKWLLWAYNLLSLGWEGSKEQYALLKKIIRILLILVIPMALAIHTVTSWLFAFNPRAGWDSTIFGPYFVSGAFVSGLSCLIVAMYFFRTNYKLEEYFTDKLFNNVGKLFVLIAFIYIYFNINELFVPGYKLKTHEAIHLRELFIGKHAMLFWSVQLIGLVIPALLLLLKPLRKPIPMLVLSLLVLIGSFFKRYIIVVPVQEHPYLPIQHVPEIFKVYSPTLIEIMITIGPMVMVLMIITVLTKLFPVVPVWEMAQHSNKEK